MRRTAYILVSSSTVVCKFFLLGDISRHLHSISNVIRQQSFTWLISSRSKKAEVTTNMRPSLN